MMQVLVDGVVAASFITLGVVGLSMIYNILNFPTFAQGDHIASGAYIALGIVAIFGTAGSIAGLSFGWPLIIALIGAVILNGIVALAIDRAIFGRLRRQNASRISLIMASFGVALMLRHVIVMFAGHLLLSGLVAMAMLVEIARRVARMVVMFAGDFFWAGLVAVAVLVQIARLVSGMIVMRSGLFLWHCFLQMLRGRHAA